MFNPAHGGYLDFGREPKYDNGIVQGRLNCSRICGARRSKISSYRGTLPAVLTSWRFRVCGKIAVIFGSSPARTIGIIFGRIYFSDTKSHLPKQMLSPLALLSIAASGSVATTAAKSMSINPQKCLGPTKSLLSHSLRIRYFEMKTLCRAWARDSKTVHGLVGQEKMKF
jgi:hypothetical protein